MGALSLIFDVGAKCSFCCFGLDYSRINIVSLKDCHGI